MLEKNTIPKNNPDLFLGKKGKLAHISSGEDGSMPGICFWDDESPDCVFLGINMENIQIRFKDGSEKWIAWSDIANVTQTANVQKPKSKI